MRRTVTAVTCVAALSLLSIACGGDDTQVPGDDAADTSDASDAIDTGDVAADTNDDADPDVAADADPDAPGDTSSDADADVDVDPDAESDTAEDAATDPIPSLSPTDLDTAAETLVRVFERMGLDPENARDVRRVWTNDVLYLAYLRTWADVVGVTFPEAGGSKADCAHLTAFDLTVPYCGPGCGNDVTLAPPCLNQACYEHDACYAAHECETGNAIDVGLSFGPLTVCCDEPLNTIWTACVGSVAADFVAGRIGLADLAMFNAVSGLMLAMNNLSVLDAPTDLEPLDCSKTFEEACGDAELVTTLVPARIVEDAGITQVCATLQRDGSDVIEWTLGASTAGPGAVVPATAASIADGTACVAYTAPAELPDGETTVSIELTAIVAANPVATRVVAVTLVGDLPELVVDGATARTVEVGDPALPLCFTARIGEEPQAAVPVSFAMAGAGSLASTSGVTDAAGRVCVSYEPPESPTSVVDVVTAAAEVGGRSVTAAVAITVEDPAPSPDAVWEGTVEVSMYFLSRQPFLVCPETEEVVTATATLRVECGADVPSAGGTCSIVRGAGQMDYSRGYPTKPTNTVYGAEGGCEPDGSCPRGGTCFADVNCTCSPSSCGTNGVCARGIANGGIRIDLSASGAIENELSGVLLTFADSPAGTVSGTVSNVPFQATGFGGTYRESPAFAGDVTPEERERALVDSRSDVGPFLAEASLYSGRSGASTFTGTATEDTITASWIDPGFRTTSPPNALLEGNASARISLRRVR